MCLKRYLAAALAVYMLLFAAFPAYAAEEEKTVNLQVESEHVDGKVNDPVTKKTWKALIFNENPSFRIESPVSSLHSVDIIVYSNEYVEGEDRGIRNRKVKKSVKIGESFSLLPEESYEDALEDGSLYDFVNHCYVLRIFTDAKDMEYVDHYIGIVDDNIYSEMYEQQEERLAAAKAKNKRLGPAGRVTE